MKEQIKIMTSTEKIHSWMYQKNLQYCEKKNMHNFENFHMNLYKVLYY